MKIVELVEWQTDTGRVLVRKTSEGKFSVVIGEATVNELEDLHRALKGILAAIPQLYPSENMVAD